MAWLSKQREQHPSWRTSSVRESYQINSRIEKLNSDRMQPTRTRYRAAGFLMALAAVTYLDRICISILAPDIQRDLNLTKVQMSFVFMAFAIAYAGFEIVTAWWGERIG